MTAWTRAKIPSAAYDFRVGIAVPSWVFQAEAVAHDDDGALS
jgi:hypothetical protein